LILLERFSGLREGGGLRKEQRGRDSSRMGEHELLRLGNSQQILRLLFTASLASAFALIRHDRLQPNEITNVSGARKTASRANGPDYGLKHMSEIAYSWQISHYPSITSTCCLLPPQSMQTTIQCFRNVYGEASPSTHERPSFLSKLIHLKFSFNKPQTCARFKQPV
jgi:hypothetical protein